jgi:5'-nucleotidase
LEKRKLILISNDDGILAKGLVRLIEVARVYGDVVVSAPAEQMSGMSHAITIKTPLRANLVHEEEGLKIFRCKGTPVDCVKLALNQLTPGKPDLVLSGINHGSNSSSSVVYSGTMAAAMEGCINLIPSAGFSLLDFSHDADFDAAGKIAGKIIGNMLESGLPEGICLNVNIPATSFDAIKGIKICRQTRGFWKEEFVKRVDPHNGEYYWLTGSFFNQEPNSVDTDEYLLAQNYVSIVPIRVDLTSEEGMQFLNSWDLNTIWKK